MSRLSVDRKQVSVSQPIAADRRLMLDLGLGFLAFLLYSSTLSPGLLPADAGEYQAVGALLGVAHPPGFALYTILSWLISRAPFISPAVAINGLSALLAALTLIGVSRAVRVWTDSTWAGLCAALALGASTTFWAQAITANVRMFTACAVALALAALAHYRRHTDDPRALAGLALGLGVAVSHHGSVVFLAAALGLYALSLNWRVLRRPWPLLVGLVPFLAWLYFPLRAGAYGSPPNARTWEGFLDQILARGWSGDMLAFATAEALPDRLRVFGVLLPFQWNWILLALAGLGAVVLVIRNWRLSTAIVGGFALHSFIAITYRAPQTTEYLLPAYVLMAVAMGFACAELFHYQLPMAADALSRLRRLRSWLPAVRFGLSTIVLAALAWQFTTTYPAYRALARDDSTRAFARAVLEDAPQGAVILAPWHWVTPLWYLRDVEGQRPDVDVIYVVPRRASYAQDWVDEINARLPVRPVVVTSFFKTEYQAMSYRFLPLGALDGQPVDGAWEVRAAPLHESPAGLAGAQAFDDLEFLGYRAQSPVTSSPTVISLAAAWRVNGPPRDVNFFVHVIGPDGRLYGQQDVSYPAARYAAGEVLLDHYEIDLLPEALPGIYALTAGAYRPDGTRIAETTLETLTLLPGSTPPATAHPQFRSVGGATLVGYDVDGSLPGSRRVYLHWQLGRQAATVTILGASLALPAGPGYATTPLDLPPDQPLDGLESFLMRSPASSRYVPFGRDLILIEAAFSPRVARPGEAVTVDLEFLAARPITTDLSVKVDLAGAGWRAQMDRVPVGGALPTLKWITGARIRDRYTLTISPDARPGPAQLVLGWYDGFTQRDLPILDPRLAQLGPTAPLGTVEIQP